jgi:5-methylthioadenosine/S-adenosylhomocysteine deaminase
MATANGSKATFFDDIGIIKPGNRADIILIDLDHITNPYLDPDTNMVDALLYRGRGLDVNTTIVDGTVIMKDRIFTKVNKDHIWRDLKKCLSKDLTEEELERKEVSRTLLPYVEDYYNKWHFNSDHPSYFFNQT